MEYNTLSVTARPGRITVITLNRPGARNALSIEMRREISAALDLLKGDKNTGAVIFTGAGNVF